MPTFSRAHGTSGYTGGCRCHTCVTAKRAHLRERYRRRAYGRPTTDLVDAAPVRAHLHALMAAGATLDQITDEAGVSYGVPSRVLYLGQKRVKANSAAAILDLPVRPRVSGSPVDASGSQRRVQALAVLGWSLAWQARQCGLWPIETERLARGDKQRVSAATAAAIRDLYDRHWNTEPDPDRYTTRVRNTARRLGWLPPLAWDDELLDLPEVELQAELQRRVDVMDSVELWRCHQAWRQGDPSPLMAVAGRQYRRRKKARAKERQSQRLAA